MTYTAEAYFKHSHGEHPVRVTSPDEVDALIDAMLAESFANSLAVLYLRDRPELESGGPDHEVRIGVNGDDKVGGVCLVLDGQVWFTKGQHTRDDDVFYNYMGNGADFPRDSEISLDALRTAVKEILAGAGVRAESVEWSESAA
ncbi:MAG: hypothetical protein QOG10_949 [Kribbellaceae bacterium]|jgi:hypothetical protein|nr:hypothetical protein [Kribbellaceae bacterium]